MPEKELGPKSFESEAGYLVNNQVCVPNTRSTHWESIPGPLHHREARPSHVAQAGNLRKGQHIWTTDKRQVIERRTLLEIHESPPVGESP